MGTLYYGDNLDILRQYLKDESVDLVYLAPPFNWARSSPADMRLLSGGRSGSKGVVDINNLWFVFRRPSSTPPRPPAQAAKRPAPAPPQRRELSRAGTAMSTAKAELRRPTGVGCSDLLAWLLKSGLYKMSITMGVRR
jgi:hypothetical protein